MTTAPRQPRTKAERVERAKVRFEMQVPAVWAWHDHAKASRHAQRPA